VPALRLLEVGVEQLGLDGLEVARRIDGALGMHDVGSLVGTDDVDQRVGLADLGQEPVAEALPGVGASNQPGDVVDGEGLVDHRRRSQGRGDLVESRIADRDHGHIGLDGGEWVPGRLGAGSGQGVEERALARVREPDDPDLHRASLAMAVPSAAPPRTSDG
jgi:hypothetical protein